MLSESGIEPSISRLKKFYNIQLYRNSIAFMLNSVLSSFYGIFFWIVAARLMPASDIGIATTTISAATMVLSLSRLGFDTGLMRFLPSSDNKNSMYNTVAIITVFTSILLALVYLSGLDIFSPAQRFLRDGWLPLIFLGYIAIVSVTTVQNSTIIALRRADLLLVQNVILGIRIPLLYFIVALGFTGILFSFNIAYLLSCVIGMIILYKYKIVFKPKIRLSSIKESFTFSFGNYVAGIISIVPTTVLPIMIINYLGADQSAYFYIAYSIASILFIIPGAISTSLFVEGSNELPLKDNTIKSIKFIILTLLPAVLVIILFGSNLLSLFNKDYSTYSLQVLIVMSISSIFTIVSQVYLAIKKVQKDVMMVNYVICANSLLIVALGYLLLPAYGILGVGYAWLIANIITSVAIIYYVVRHEKWL